jgi:hypothetical protein
VGEEVKLRPIGLSGVGEEVKLCELQYETKWSVMGGRWWGRFGANANTSCKVAK